MKEREIIPIYPNGVIEINCEACGKQGKLFNTDVEGSILNLCGECSKFGKVISIVVKEKKKELKKEQVKSQEEELILSIVPNYGELIKKRREELGIKQEDFAKSINEKISLIHKIETNQFEPGIDLARKIEKFLHIKLIEQQKIKPEILDKTKGKRFTIGDFIKVKE